jgi:hypothetical protein
MTSRSTKTPATEEPKSAEPTPTTDAGDHGEAQVQSAFDAANEKGYFGETTDPTPDEHYGVAGVLAGKPTPETDEAQAAAVAAHQKQVAASLGGPSAGKVA